MDAKQPANVTVVVRVRPPESGPANKHVVGVFPAVGAHDTIIVDRDGSEARRGKGDARPSVGPTSPLPGASSGGGSGSTFTFDKVFWSMYAGSKDQERQGSFGRCPAPFSSQRCVFEGIGHGVVNDCLAGFNTCLFAYGQTGSGKTFTMMGSDPSAAAAAAAAAATASTAVTAVTAAAAAAAGTVASAPLTALSPSAAAAAAAAQAKAAMPPPPPVEFHPRKKSPIASGDAHGRRSSFGRAPALAAAAAAAGNGSGNDAELSTKGVTRPPSILTSREYLADPAEQQSEPSSPAGAAGEGERPGGVDGAHDGQSPEESESKGGERPDGDDARGDGGGPTSNRGVIPRICDFLFERAEAITAEANGGEDASALGGGGGGSGGSGRPVGDSPAGKQKGMKTRWMFSVSFTEIYMERVRDLLDTSGRPSQGLKVREHPTKGPFVEGAVRSPVTTARETEQLLVDGQARRVVAGTNMNEASSRSHAIFTIVATKIQVDLDTGAEGQTTSKVNLVDLAGSENSNTAGSAGTRLKEGAAINKSLLTLGRVIKALVDASSESRPRQASNQSPRKSDRGGAMDAGEHELLESPASWGSKRESGHRSASPPSPSHGSASSGPTTVGDEIASTAAAAAAASAAAPGGTAMGGDRPRLFSDNRLLGEDGLLRAASSLPLLSPASSPRLSTSPRATRRDAASPSSGGGGGGDGGGGSGGGGRHSVGGGGRVPYRESVLTFLLKDSLGGNSHTTMIATVRPGARYLEETMSTLRYADQAKSIVNSVRINEDPFARTVRRLNLEIATLRQELAASKRQESLALAQADGLKREVDLLQVVDATLIASIKRHDTSLIRKVPYNLNISTDGISGGEESDESDYGDVPTPQLTPVSTAVAGGGDAAASETVVTVALGVALEDGEASNARQIPRGRGRKQRAGLTISGDDEQQQQVEGEKQQQVAREEQQHQAGKEQQQQQVGEERDEEEEEKEGGGQGGEGTGETTTMSTTQTASSVQAMPPTAVTMFSNATTTTLMTKTTERTSPEWRRDEHPEENSPEASPSTTGRVRDGSDYVKGAGSGGKREGDASGVSEPEGENPATPGFEVNGAFEPPADPPTAEQREGGARDSVSSLSSRGNGSGGSGTDVDVPEVPEQGSTEVGLEAGAAVEVTVEAVAVSETPTEVARAPERDARVGGVQEEKSGTTGPAEPRQLDGVSSGSSLGSEGGTFAERIGSFDAAIATAEAAAAAATTASATASAASAAAAAAASTAARAAAAAVAAENMSSESFSPEGAGGGKGDGGGGGGQGETVGGGATTSSLPPRIPSSSREFPTGHKEGCPEARSGAGSTQQQQQHQGQDDMSKQAGGGDGAPQENRAGPTAGGESLAAKSDAAEGGEELVERRPSALYETSGFLLGQEYPPLPPPVSLSDANGGEVLSPPDQSDQPKNSTPHKPEVWCRRWYMLRRGKLSAFSGWGVGHSCVGRLPLYGCSVEDAPEVAQAGEAPFAFRVRARWVNAIRGAADTVGPLSPPGSPTEAQKAAFYPPGDGGDAPLLSHKWRSNKSATRNSREESRPAAAGAGSEDHRCEDSAVPGRRHGSTLEGGGRGEGGGGGGGEVAGEEPGLVTEDGLFHRSAESRLSDAAVPCASGADGGGDSAANGTANSVDSSGGGGGSFRRKSLRSQPSKSSMTASRAGDREAAAAATAAAGAGAGVETAGAEEQELEWGRRVVEAGNEELALGKSCVFQ